MVVCKNVAMRMPPRDDTMRELELRGADADRRRFRSEQMTSLVSLRCAQLVISSARRCLMQAAFGAVCAGGIVGSAHAGLAVFNEAELDRIYSQPPVLDNPKIDIRFNPTVTLDEPSLLTINTDDELHALFKLGAAPPTVNLFFVDAINECGGETLPAAIGCGEDNSNHIAVESSFAQNKGSAGNPGLGSILIAHELGHNLGLDHDADPSNLMNATLKEGSWTLTQAQANTILGSDLVQTDLTGARFVSITPYAVVPEPATVLFASVGALWILQLVRRRAIA